MIRFATSKCLPYFPPAERYARLLLPCSGSLGPRFPTFPVKASHAPNHRYYDPLRLPTALLGLLRCPLSSPDTLACTVSFVFPLETDSPSGTVQSPSDAWTFGQPVAHPFRHPWRETAGSPEFPSCPCECMPCSQTPVVSRRLRHIASKTAAFRIQQTVGFPPRLSPGGYPDDHNSFLHFGAQSSRSAGHPRSVRLRTTHRWRCTRTLLLPRWLGFGQVGLDPNLDLTHWATTANFMSSHPIQRFELSSARIEWRKKSLSLMEDVHPANRL